MSLLLKVKPLVVSPVLACRIGLNEAIVLQQICYWLEDTASGIEHDGRRWVYNTIEDWNEQFPWWSSDTVKRALTSLKKSGLIYVEQLKKSQHDRTNFYSINHANPLLTDEGKLHSSKDANCTHREGQVALIEQGRLNPSMGANCTRLTENTTENTTEITEKTSCQPAAQTDREVEITDLAKRVLKHLNTVTSSRYQVSKTSMENIRARLAEGFTADELELTVDYMNAKWSADQNMSEYLRPTTLFQPTKFPGYLSAAQRWNAAGRPARVNGKWEEAAFRASYAGVDYSQIPEGFRS